RKKATRLPPITALRLRQSRSRPALSCRFLHGTLRRTCLDIPNPHPRRDRTLAPIFECHFSGDISLKRAVVQRLDKRRVAIRDEGSSELLRASEFSVVGIEHLVENKETLDLRTSHCLFRIERAVRLF